MGARVHWDARRKKWFVRVYEAGWHHKQYVGAGRDEAQTVADLINADLERVNQERDSRGIVFRIGGPVNGEDAPRWWYATYRFKRAMRDLRRGRIENHLIPHCGTMDLRRLATLHIRHYADVRFGPGASPHTVKGDVSILRRVHNALVENGILAGNPLPKIMAPVAESARAHSDPERRGSRDAWTAEEAWVLMDVAREHEPNWIPIIFFYFQTGARLGEGLPLRWDAVDLFGKDIHIRRAVAAGGDGEPKWAKHRHVSISDDLFAVLKQLARRGPIAKPLKSPELVFPSARGCRKYRPRWTHSMNIGVQNLELGHAPSTARCTP